MPGTAVDPPPVGEVVTPDGIRLHYEINGKGPTIVVLHGGPGLSSAYLAPSLDALAAHYRLIKSKHELQHGGDRRPQNATDGWCEAHRHLGFPAEKPVMASSRSRQGFCRSQGKVARLLRSA